MYTCTTLFIVVSTRPTTLCPFQIASPIARNMHIGIHVFKNILLYSLHAFPLRFPPSLKILICYIGTARNRLGSGQHSCLVHLCRQRYLVQQLSSFCTNLFPFAHQPMPHWLKQNKARVCLSSLCLCVVPQRFTHGKRQIQKVQCHNRHRANNN